MADENAVRRPRGLIGLRRTLAAGPRPQFSQPVRSVLLMLLALGLVAAGVTLAYGRIRHIFEANLALNAAILAVFGIGVLACFWQVVELIRSVSWIERFAARRASAVEAGVTARAENDTDRAPRMLAPLAALLGRSGPDGGVISTTSAASIQDSVATRIDEGRDITRYLAQLLIFLGLLGTFYGLATTVPGVVETIRGLAPKPGQSAAELFNNLMKGLESQLGGMGTAFSASLLGLAGSLVVGLLELFVSHGQNRFYRELEEWVAGFTRVSLAEGGAAGGGLDAKTLAGFLDQIARHMVQLTEFYAQRDELYEQDQLAADERALVMAKGIERLTQHVLADGDAQIARTGELTAALSRLAEGQERLVAAIHAQAEDAEARMRLRSIDQTLARLAEETNAARADMMVELRADLHGLTRAVRTLGDL